jgi:hypothetical protein
VSVLGKSLLLPVYYDVESKMKKIVISLLLVIACGNANAESWVEIDDAGKLLWQMNENGVVYFRNLNEFDAAHAGCCYSYFLDTTTVGGKAIWAVVLMKIAGHKRITLGFADIGSNAAPQRLNMIGRHDHNTNE